MFKKIMSSLILSCGLFLMPIMASADDIPSPSIPLNEYHLEACLVSGINEEVLRQKGNAASHYAVIGGNLDTLSELIRLKANVNLQNDFGNAPIHFAALPHIDPQIIKFLGDAGADVNARNLCGLMPLHIAIRNGSSVDIVQALIDIGADVNAREAIGFSAKENWTQSEMNGMNNLDYVKYIDSLVNSREYLLKNPAYADFLLSPEFTSLIDFLRKMSIDDSL